MLTWRVFYSVFFARRLVVPQVEHEFEGTPPTFPRQGGWSWYRLARGMENVKMKMKYMGLRSAIRNTLSSCLLGKKPRKNRFEKPDFTAEIVLTLPNVLNQFSNKWGLRFGGCFIHQSPRITYSSITNQRCSCELGDLLILCRDQACHYNAVLLQLKMLKTCDERMLSLTPDPKQLALYTKWPRFRWRRINQSYDISPHTVTQGALYAVVHPVTTLNGTKTSGARISMAMAAPSILTHGQPFEDYLYDFIGFRTGRTFVDLQNTEIPDEWSRLICDICSNLKLRTFTRNNIEVINVPRCNGDFFSLLPGIPVGEQRSSILDKEEAFQADVFTLNDLEENDHFGVLLIEKECW